MSCNGDIQIHLGLHGVEIRNARFHITLIVGCPEMLQSVQVFVLFQHENLNILLYLGTCYSILAGNGMRSNMGVGLELDSY